MLTVINMPSLKQHVLLRVDFHVDRGPDSGPMVDRRWTRQWVSYTFEK
jgi:hypothetical protein